MGWKVVLKRIFGTEDAGPEPAAPPPGSTGPKRPEVPEVDASQVLTQRRNGEGPLLLDCREPYEWRAARIPDSVHIPMRQIPQRLDELNREAEITVVCAHGVRSYSVAAYLIQNGFQAQSLKGGLEMWQMRGGEVERGR